MWDISLSQLTSSHFIFSQGAGFFEPIILQCQPSHLQDYSTRNSAWLEHITFFFQMNEWKMVFTAGIQTHNLWFLSKSLALTPRPRLCKVNRLVAIHVSIRRLIIQFQHLLERSKFVCWIKSFYLVASNVCGLCLDNSEVEWDESEQQFHLVCPNFFYLTNHSLAVKFKCHFRNKRQFWLKILANTKAPCQGKIIIFLCYCLFVCLFESLSL